MRSNLQIVAEQQILIEQQGKALDLVAEAAGVDLRPVKAEANRRVAAFRQRQVKTADEQNPANPIPEPSAQAPAVTTEQAKTPSATEDLTTPMGQVATDGVTPAATTDVTTPGVVLDEPLDLSEQDVTAPVQGTQENSGANKVEHDISSGIDSPPENGPMFPLDGGPFANAEKVTGSNSQARAFASLRLARLRIAANIAPAQDDVILGQAIASSGASDGDIAKEIATLSQVAKAASTSGRPPVSPSVVPSLAGSGNERGVPSLVSIASGMDVRPSSAVTEDELGDF